MILRHDRKPLDSRLADAARPRRDEADVSAFRALPPPRTAPSSPPRLAWADVFAGYRSAFGARL